MYLKWHCESTEEMMGWLGKGFLERVSQERRHLSQDLENEQASRAAPEYGEGFGYRSLGKGS